MLTPERIKALRELLRLQVYEILVEGPHHEALTADFNELCGLALKGLEAGAVVAGMENVLERARLLAVRITVDELLCKDSGLVCQWTFQPQSIKDAFNDLCKALAIEHAAALAQAKLPDGEGR